LDPVLAMSSCRRMSSCRGNCGPIASFMDPWRSERLALESDDRAARRPGSADAQMRNSGHLVQELLAFQTAPPMSRAGEYRRKRRPASADARYLHSGVPDILVVERRPGRRPDIGRFREGSGHRIQELLSHQVEAPADLPMATRPLRCNGTSRNPSRDSGRRTEDLLLHQIEPPSDLQVHHRRPGSANDCERDSDLGIEKLLKCQTAPPSSVPALAKYQWLWPAGRNDFVTDDAAAQHESLQGGFIVRGAYGCPSFSSSSFGGAGNDALWKRHILQENRRASSPSRQLPHNRSDGVRSAIFSNPARCRRGRTQSQMGAKGAALARATAAARRVPWQSTERRLGCSVGCRRPCSPLPRCCGQRRADPASNWRLPCSPFR